MPYCDSKPLCRKKSERRFISSCRSRSSAAPGAYFEYFVYFILIELAARHSAGRLPRFAWFRRLPRLGEKSTLFASVYALMRPEPFENELCCAGLNGGIILRADTQRFQMLEQPLYFLELAQQLTTRCVRRNLQLAADFEPLHDRLKVDVLEILREGFSDRCANQFPRNIVCAAHLTLVFEFELSGHRRDGGIHIGDARDHRGFVTAHGALLRAAE